jgi:hypothetical protein
MAWRREVGGRTLILVGGRSILIGWKTIGSQRMPIYEESRLFSSTA